MAFDCLDGIVIRHGEPAPAGNADCCRRTRLRRKKCPSAQLVHGRSVTAVGAGHIPSVGQPRAAARVALGLFEETYVG